MGQKRKIRFRKLKYLTMTIFSLLVVLIKPDTHYVFFVFSVFETIRTGTMHVLRIITVAKTESSQRLRIMFVLYCPT